MRVSLMHILVSILLTITLTEAQESNPDEWTPDVMPNPKRNPRHCRPANRHNQMAPGYICDPDGILSERHVELLDWLLKGFHVNDTMCSCATYWCEQERKTGTFATIAIVRKMKVEDNFDDPDTAALQAGNNFALRLERDMWNFGPCDNDIVIFFSRDDGVVYDLYNDNTGFWVADLAGTNYVWKCKSLINLGGPANTLSLMHGPTVAKNLTSGMIDYIQNLHGYHFQSGGNYFTGFAEIILSLRDALNGRYPYTEFDPRTDRLVGGAGCCRASGFMAILTLLFISMILL